MSTCSRLISALALTLLIAFTSAQADDHNAVVAGHDRHDQSVATFSSVSSVAVAGVHHLHHRHHQHTKSFQFNVKYSQFTRLCHTKRMVTVNDEFPGPTVYIREGDRVLINVTNQLPNKNITIHWHGVRQLRSGWYDGPAYVTQCPIQPGHSYLYNFTVSGQRGTLFWHAHISWMRSTVHGAFIILPKHHQHYPFPTPAAEIPIVLSEWWNSDTDLVIQQALRSGAGPNVSDAYTINGQPGTLYNCSSKESMFKFQVEPNRTYMLRIVNAALNDELFLSVANHKLTVVEIDATYTKPLIRDTILIAPGQTTNVLLTTNQPIGKYILAVRAYNSAGPSVPFDNTTSIAQMEYKGSATTTSPNLLQLPSLPTFNDTNFANNFTSSLRSLNSQEFPCNVPTSIDRNLLFTVGLARKPCPTGQTCGGPNGGKFAAAINNISFNLPSTALLQSFFIKSINLMNDKNQKSNVFLTNFPDKPTQPFNYVGAQPKNITPKMGTRLSWLAYNSSVQLVLQGTSILGTESHPIHLHGFNFFVVGQGNGNYNDTKDPATFNLVDPPERNTVNVPKGGWVAIRFRADNPGVWFMHCHLEVHTSWGLETAFLVPNGIGPNHSLEPPPSDLPTC